MLFLCAAGSENKSVAASVMSKATVKTAKTGLTGVTGMPGKLPPVGTPISAERQLEAAAERLRLVRCVPRPSV